MKTIAFFNNKGGVGKTTLVYHLAWMYSELGKRVLAIDMDPQTNLTSMFLPDEKLESLWYEEEENQSILSCIQPIMDGVGDISDAPLQQITENLSFIPGNLGLSQFEDKLSDSWPRCLDKNKAAFRAMTAFYRIIYDAAQKMNAEMVLLDVGPNLGAMNRASLIAADYVVMPLAPGLYSIQGLKNLGPVLKVWRENWAQRLEAKPLDLDIPMPKGKMEPAGYIVMQHVKRKSRPVKAFQKWISNIPQVYATSVLQKKDYARDVSSDPNQIGFIKNYQGLMSMAEEARKPIFLLRPADGAIGSYAVATRKCHLDFKQLAEAILKRTEQKSKI